MAYFYTFDAIWQSPPPKARVSVPRLLPGYGRTRRRRPRPPMKCIAKSYRRTEIIQHPPKPLAGGAAGRVSFVHAHAEANKAR
jgi:hypothetical protein